MAKFVKGSETRRPGHPVESLFVDRWSPRAMSGEPLTDGELNLLLEAARWAPSSFNEQPWRFLYGKRDTPHFATFFDLLMDANKKWCDKAAVLMLVSRKTFSHNNTPNPVHAYDAGAAWENLALQGAAMGLVVHGMAGFNYNMARTALNIPAEFDVQAMLAVGRPGDLNQLPEPQRSREKPSDRKPLSEIAREGKF